MLSLLALLTTTQVSPPEPPRELTAYVNSHDPSYSWKVKARLVTAKSRTTDIAMTSQTWQGIPWRHTVVVVEPATSKPSGTAILYITGDDPNPADRAELSKLAAMSGLPAAMLFNIPVQPIFGLEEDNLIAHTFKQYLDSGDPTWPLLFPMTKSAVRAMDAVQAFSNGKIRRFVVTGGSKRGWTAWMTAATGDNRVAGIAPMVIDNLNTAAQMAHQRKFWGRYSDMFEPYVSRKIMERLKTPAGKRLALIIDPFSYRRRLTMPTLVVNGANDPYWAVDATTLYWSELRQPKWLLEVPNAGHLLGDKVDALNAIAAFSASVAGKFKFPTPTFKGDSKPVHDGAAYRQFEVVSKGPGLASISVWQAESDDFDFKKSVWKSVSGKTNYDVDGPGGSDTAISFLTSAKRNVAEFVEAEYRIAGFTFKLCSPVHLYPAQKSPK